MTEYLIRRAPAVILWTNLALTQSSSSLTRSKPNWSVAASSYERVCPTPFVAQAVWNGIATRTESVADAWCHC